MFMTLELTDGTEATVNTAYITHVTQLESLYPEAGSCVHFASDRVLQIKMSLPQLLDIIERSEPAGHQSAGAPFMLSKA